MISVKSWYWNGVAWGEERRWIGEDIIYSGSYATIWTVLKPCPATLFFLSTETFGYVAKMRKCSMDFNISLCFRFFKIDVEITEDDLVFATCGGGLYDMIKSFIVVFRWWNICANKVTSDLAIHKRGFQSIRTMIF